jgi:uncharacterized membrane protein YoaK (UPF0700 family)
MKQPLTALLSFNAGFVDTVGFLGLQGLFTAHVTGNFVTFAAALVLGTHGAVGKMLALPEFVAVVALARLAGAELTRRQMPTLTLLLAAKTLCLLAFLMLGVAFGPFPNSDVPTALLAGLAGIAAMALQNAIQRVHFASVPPTTIMTNNTTQAVLDAVDLLRGVAPPEVRGRFERIFRSIAAFAFGCAAAALLYYLTAFWSLLVAVVVAIAVVFLQLRADPGSGPHSQQAG